jgi:hypothetical protein
VLINQLMESRSSLMRRIEASMKDVVTERVRARRSKLTMPQTAGDGRRMSGQGSRVKNTSFCVVNGCPPVYGILV